MPPVCRRWLLAASWLPTAVVAVAVSAVVACAAVANLAATTATAEAADAADRVAAAAVDAIYSSRTNYYGLFFVLLNFNLFKLP